MVRLSNGVGHILRELIHRLQLILPSFLPDDHMRGMNDSVDSPYAVQQWWAHLQWSPLDIVKPLLRESHAVSLSRLAA